MSEPMSPFEAYQEMLVAEAKRTPEPMSPERLAEIEQAYASIFLVNDSWVLLGRELLAEVHRLRAEQIPLEEALTERARLLLENYKLRERVQVLKEAVRNLAIVADIWQA